MTENASNRIELDDALRDFLWEVRSGQSLALASWASRVLNRGLLTRYDLERCFILGFEG